MNGSTNLQIQAEVERKGERPANAVTETIERILVSTVAFNGGSVVAERQFFTNDSAPVQYRNEQFPTTGVAYVITGLQVEHNMLFAQSTIGKSVLQDYFEKFSRISIKVSDKDYFTAPIVNLMPTFTSYLGTTVANNVRRNAWFPLTDRITIASGERAEFKFLPAQNLTLDAVTTATSPYLPGLGLTADQGYSITLRLRTLITRRVK